MKVEVKGRLRVASQVGPLLFGGVPALYHSYCFHQSKMDQTEKQLALETISAMPDDCSLEEIAERIEFMVAVKKGIDQLDQSEGIPHDEAKRQLASWLTS